MKKTMSKNKKKAKDTDRRNPEVNMEAVRIRKTVRDAEAFYFYEAVGKPTGETARNLSEFMDKVESVRPETLMFHHMRGDFPNWVEKTLGDSKLARKLRKISSSDGDEARKKIRKTVANRLKELEETSTAVLVDESLAVLQPSS
jgi:hypothetical protein